MNQKICTIHQPEHLPWLGFWHKLVHADIFIILDNVQFKRRHFENRNKIRNKDQAFWITIPVKPSPRDSVISEIEISYNENWQEKNLKSIYRGYQKTKYFNQVFPLFETVYNHKYKLLVDFNIALIEFVLLNCGIENQIVKSSVLQVPGKASELIANLCKAVNARTYFSGQSGKEYLQLEDFKENHINIRYQEFEIHDYPQVGTDFIPHLSVLDFLFNCGFKSLKPFLI